MKLVSYSTDEKTSIGAVNNDHVVDLADAIIDAPVNMISFLEQGQAARERANIICKNPQKVIQLDQVKLHSPILKPSKFLALGINYKKHAEEAKKHGVEIPTEQMWFNKQVSCITGPYDPVHLPKVSTMLDYEAELAFVIGERCRHVLAHDAHKVIAGYIAGNDVSVRDWQLHTTQWSVGKSFDTHGPLGPWLVTSDEVGDPQNLSIRGYVNGELRQDSNTSDMIYTCYEMVEYLTKAMTLEPGDIIITGTPAGVGFGMNPRTFLKSGDIVRVEIEKIGFIENTVIQEPNL